MSPAPNGNKNAAGKRVERDRIKIAVSVSKKNTLLDLISKYLLSQGIDPTDEQIRQFVNDWFYSQMGEWLKRKIEIDDSAIIL